MTPDNVTIIIPALNETQSIGRLVSELRANLPGAELIVVNDGSTDSTAETAERAGARVISHESQKGYGAGLKTGVKASTRDYVLFCDADGQHTHEDVGRIIEATDDFDMVVGERGRQSHVPITRRPGKLVLKVFANYLAGRRIPDLNSGLRIVKKEILLRYIHLMPQGFSFSTTSTFALMKTNHRIKYVPITVKKRIGKSTVRQLRHGPQTIMLMLQLAVLFEPLKVFMTVSVMLFCLFLMSLSMDVVVATQDGAFFSRLVCATNDTSSTTASGHHSGEFENEAPQPAIQPQAVVPTTGLVGHGIGDTTVLFFIAALIVFMSGLLCDQVSALRRELHE